jgi:hypothetical protein
LVAHQILEREKAAEKNNNEGTSNPLFSLNDHDETYIKSVCHHNALIFVFKHVLLRMPTINCAILHKDLT